jgi:hypothetical protein
MFYDNDKAISKGMSPQIAAGTACCDPAKQCPLSEPKPTSPCDVETSAFDPERRQHFSRGDQVALVRWLCAPV